MKISKGTFAVVIDFIDAEGQKFSVAIGTPKTEVSIHTAYGLGGAWAWINVYNIPDVAIENFRYGDNITINFGDGISFFGRLKKIQYSPSGIKDDNTWCLRIGAWSDSWWAMKTRRPFSYESEQRDDLVEAVKKAIASCKLNEAEQVYVVYVGKDEGSSNYSYTSIFNDGSQSIGEIIDDMVEENGWEWYCVPFDNSIAIGNPIPTFQSLRWPDLMEYARIKVSKFNDVPILAFQHPGDSRLTTGFSFAHRGKWWKIVVGEYAERGDGSKESYGYAMQTATICSKKIIQWILGRGIDKRNGNVNHTILSKSKLHEENFYENTNKAKFLISNPDVNNVKQYEFFDGLLADDMVMCTPFAGDGVGLRFPMEDEGNHLLTFPEKKHKYGMLGMMFWDDEQDIPECNREDFYLRMSKGYLYLDEESETWLLKAKVVKLQSDSLEDVDTKPDPTTESGSWIELDSSGVVVHGSEIKLGKDATLDNAKKNDNINISSQLSTWVTAVTGATGVLPLAGTVIGSIDASSNVKSE